VNITLSQRQGVIQILAELGELQLVLAGGPVSHSPPSQHSAFGSIKVFVL